MLTQNILKKMLSYDELTGDLYWIKRDMVNFKTVGAWKRWNTIYSGSKCGGNKKNANGKQYSELCIFNRMYKSHRIIWLLVHGYWPNQIDHINGNGLDNRIINLRDVTPEENARNQCVNIRNVGGILGVSFNKSRDRWQSCISDKGVNIHLGWHKDLFSAACARKSAERKYGYHENHGTKRPL